MADSKLADLTAITTPATTDILYLVHDPAGTPVDRKITVANLLGASAVKACILAQTTAQTIGTSMTTMTWDTEITDPAGMHEGVTNPSRITIPTTGVYTVKATVKTAANSLLRVDLYKNGSVGSAGNPLPSVETANSNPQGACITADLSLTAGDYLEVKAQNISSAGNTYTEAVSFSVLGPF